MSANISDKLTAVENGGNPQPTTVSSARSIGGTSLSCVALANWPTVSSVHLITYKKKADGTMDRSTLCLWKGIVSGTTIGTLTLKGGTDAGNAVGDFVEMAGTSAYSQDLYDGLTQTLNADGTLKTGVVTTAKLATGAVTTSTLADSIWAMRLLARKTLTSGFTNATATATLVTGFSAAVTIPTGASCVRISVFGREWFNTTSAALCVAEIWDGAVGGTLIGMSVIKMASASQSLPLALFATQTVTAGSKTYNVSLRQSGGGIATIAGDATYPATMLVEVIG